AAAEQMGGGPRALDAGAEGERRVLGVEGQGDGDVLDGAAAAFAGAARDLHARAVHAGVADFHPARDARRVVTVREADLLRASDQVVLGEPERAERAAAAALERELGRRGPRVAGLDPDHHRIAGPPGAHAHAVEDVERAQAALALARPRATPGLAGREQQ